MLRNIESSVFIFIICLLRGYGIRKEEGGDDIVFECVWNFK